jgi:hypothetical protein
MFASGERLYRGNPAETQEVPEETGEEIDDCLFLM